MVFAQLRGPVRPLQGVEAERHAVVLKGGVRQQRCPLLQRRGGGRHASAGVALAEAGDELGEGRLPRRLVRRRGHRLVVGLGAGLAYELQVALGLAVQIPFQDLVRDLHGRVPPQMFILRQGVTTAVAFRSIVLEVVCWPGKWRPFTPRRVRWPGKRIVYCTARRRDGEDNARRTSVGRAATSTTQCLASQCRGLDVWPLTLYRQVHRRSCDTVCGKIGLALQSPEGRDRGLQRRFRKWSIKAFVASGGRLAPKAQRLEWQRICRACPFWNGIDLRRVRVPQAEDVGGFQGLCGRSAKMGAT